MIEMGICKGSNCNYCGEYKKGYIWKRESDSGYIAICRSCAKQIKKHQYSKQREYSDTFNAESQRKAKELKQAYMDYQNKAYEMLANKNELQWKRIPKVNHIIDSLTYEESACIAAYETVVNRTEMAKRSERAKQTYIRNRLFDDRANKSLLEDGFIESRYFGFIRLSEILKWDIWNEEERNRLECIDMGHEQFKREKQEKYERERLNTEAAND